MFRTRALVVGLLIALAGLLVALGRERQRGATLGLGTDRAGGKVERCVTCHVRPEEDPGGAHARAAVGCSSCHLGNELAFDKARAHAGMEPEPGALRTVARTCGRSGCHVREAQRVATSLMARASGIVSVNRWVFGELPAPRGTASMAETLSKADKSSAERHLSKLCAGCHLHTLRGNRDDAIHGNGSGCSSCHVARKLPGAVPRPHPAVDARVTDDRCLGCHSRSGRIALTYEGLYEVEKDQVGACGAAATTLHDGRPACRAQADVHRLAGLSCIDCHLHTDLMGDNREWEHEEEQVEITCEACHGPVRAGSKGTETTWGEVTDPISRDLLRQRGETRPPDERVRLGRRGSPLWNLRPSGSGWFTLRKGQGVALAHETDADRPEPCTSRARAADVQLLPRRVGAHLLDLPYVLRPGRQAMGLREGRREPRPLGRVVARLLRQASRPRRSPGRPHRPGHSRNGDGPRRDRCRRSACLTSPLCLPRPALDGKEGARLCELPPLVVGPRPRHGHGLTHGVRARIQAGDTGRGGPANGRGRLDPPRRRDARPRHPGRPPLARHLRASPDPRRRSLSPVSQGGARSRLAATSPHRRSASRGAGRVAGFGSRADLASPLSGQSSSTEARRGPKTYGYAAAPVIPHLARSVFLG